MHSRVWHPYTRHSALGSGPEFTLPRIVRGEGIYLFDDSGRKLIDAISSWWCVNLGHGHPRIVEAIRRQAGTLQHSILGNLTHPGAEKLSVALAELMPSPDRRVIFASDGASAVEAALKVSVQYFFNRGEGRRSQFVALTDPYHGDTLGAVSVGYMESFHRPVQALTFETHRIPTPPRGDFSGSLARFDALLANGADRLAAVVIESLCQGASGMRMYDPAFLAALATRCRQHGILLVADEIAMGFGRTGSLFAFEQAGVDPDIVCLGKGLSAGMLPISAAVVRDSIYRTFDDIEKDRTFYHGHTFAGNPIACAAALETMVVYQEENVVEAARISGEYLANRAAELADCPRVQEVRCLGMIAAVELEATREDMDTLRQSMLSKGALLRPLGKVIYLMPPLVTPLEVLDDLVDMLSDSIRALPDT